MVAQDPDNTLTLMFGEIPGNMIRMRFNKDGDVSLVVGNPPKGQEFTLSSDRIGFAEVTVEDSSSNAALRAGGLMLNSKDAQGKTTTAKFILE